MDKVHHFLDNDARKQSSRFSAVASSAVSHYLPHLLLVVGAFSLLLGALNGYLLWLRGSSWEAEHQEIMDHLTSMVNTRAAEFQLMSLFAGVTLIGLSIASYIPSFSNKPGIKIFRVFVIFVELILIIELFWIAETATSLVDAGLYGWLPPDKICLVNTAMECRGWTDQECQIEPASDHCPDCTELGFTGVNEDWGGCKAKFEGMMVGGWATGGAYGRRLLGVVMALLLLLDILRSVVLWRARTRRTDAEISSSGDPNLSPGRVTLPGATMRHRQRILPK